MAKIQIQVPGNYPFECWSIGEQERAGLQEQEEIFIILVDIDNFTELTAKSSIGWANAFITKFFMSIEENFDNFAISGGFCINKYIGDAVFATFQGDKTKEVITSTRNLMKRFYAETSQELAVLIDKVYCLKGGVGGNLYFDYSYWGALINRIFKAIKELDQGVIWFTDRIEEFVDYKPYKVIRSGRFDEQTIFGIEIEYEGAE